MLGDADSAKGPSFPTVSKPRTNFLLRHRVASSASTSPSCEHGAGPRRSLEVYLRWDGTCLATPSLLMKKMFYWNRLERKELQPLSAPCMQLGTYSPKLSIRARPARLRAN